MEFKRDPRFGRMIPAMVTPFNADLELDLDRAQELADRLVRGGADALIVNGTTGESPTVFYPQKLELFRAVVRAVNGRIPVIANVGDNCTADTVYFAQDAAKQGVDGFMCVVPYYNKPPQEGLYRHFKTIADSVTTKDGSVVYGKNGTGIYYDSLPAKNNRERMWHTVVVPRGGEYYICLSDGSEVWLNSETKISYPVYFTGDLREISLSGEAYFKVAKENTRPFCVRSGEYCLKVYGTEFNLNTYDEENIEAVLVKGSVGFQANEAAPEKRLKVNQLGVANSKAGTSVIQDVDVTSYIAWKNHDLIFVNEELESIMKKVSRWYDVNIIFEDEVSKAVRFNGNIPKYAELEKLLYVMEKTSDVRFRITDKTIRITKRKK